MAIGPTTDDEMIDPFDHDEKKARDTAKILQLKNEGKAHWEISKILNLSTTMINHRLKEASAALRDQAYQEHFAIEHARLEEMGQDARRLWKARMEDDPELALKAMDRAQRAAEARIKLTGIAAPDKSEVNVGVTDVSPELKKRMAEATAAKRGKKKGRG